MKFAIEVYNSKLGVDPYFLLVIFYCNIFWQFKH